MLDEAIDQSRFCDASGPQSGSCLRNMNSIRGCLFVSAPSTRLIWKSSFCAPGNGALIPCSKLLHHMATPRRVCRKTWRFPQHAQTMTDHQVEACFVVRHDFVRLSLGQDMLRVLHPRGDGEHQLHVAAFTQTLSASLRSNLEPQSNWRRCRHHAHKT